MAPKPQALRRILDADPTLAGWDARRRREKLLTDFVRRHLPRPLADRIRVVDATGTDLVLAADAGAVAGIARQRTPGLLAELRRNGWEFSGIRIRAQVGAASPPEQKIPRKQLDKNDFRPLGELTRSLPPGPLKTALARFLRKAGG